MLLPQLFEKRLLAYPTSPEAHAQDRLSILAEKELGKADEDPKFWKISLTTGRYVKKDTIFVKRINQ
jgi:hypothetical protein